MNFGLRDLSIHHNVQLPSARRHGGRPVVQMANRGVINAEACEYGTVCEQRSLPGRWSAPLPAKKGGDNKFELTN